MFREAERIIDNNQLKLTEEDLQAAAAKLREKQFVFKDGHGQGRFYNTLVNQQEYFTKLFGSFGDAFFIDHHFGFCGILPRAPRPALKRLDTLFLLILAKMHDHELRQARSINGRTIPSEALLLDEYCQLTGREKPKQVETRFALERLQKMNVIVLGDVQEDSAMQKIEVLPSLMRVVSDQYLSLLEGHVDKGSLAGTQDREIEQAEHMDNPPTPEMNETEAGMLTDSELDGNSTWEGLKNG